MKQDIVLFAMAITLTATYQVTAQPTPLVTKLHTVSIHVKDHQVHEAVTRFLREDLQLPLVYEPVTYGVRRYVGLWAGNLVLEPYGPYSNIAYATPDFKAIFCGLTFEAYESSQQSSVQLERRKIKFKPLGSFVIINDPNLCEGNLVASIMNNPGRVEEQQKHSALTAQLQANAGGPLGVQCVIEILVGYTHQQDIAAWKNLLAPYKKNKASQWQLGTGPAIRLLKSERKEIKGIVLRVNSLPAAIRTLKAQNLLGQMDAGRVQIKAPDHWEFSIFLQE